MHPFPLPGRPARGHTFFRGRLFPKFNTSMNRLFPYVFLSHGLEASPATLRQDVVGAPPPSPLRRHEHFTLSPPPSIIRRGPFSCYLARRPG